MSNEDEKFARDMAWVRFWTWRVLLALCIVCATCAQIATPRG